MFIKTNISFSYRFWDDNRTFKVSSKTARKTAMSKLNSKALLENATCLLNAKSLQLTKAPVISSTGSPLDLERSRTSWRSLTFKSLIYGAPIFLFFVSFSYVSRFVARSYRKTRFPSLQICHLRRCFGKHSAQLEIPT